TAEVPSGQGIWQQSTQQRARKWRVAAGEGYRHGPIRRLDELPSESCRCGIGTDTCQQPYDRLDHPCHCRIVTLHILQVVLIGERIEMAALRVRDGSIAGSPLQQVTTCSLRKRRVLQSIAPDVTSPVGLAVGPFAKEIPDVDLLLLEAV